MGNRLARLDALAEWTDEQYARAEKDLMLGAFYIRKLGESKKFTDLFWNQDVPVTSFPLKKAHPPTYLTNHRPEDFYDFDRGRSGRLSLATLCNQIIHSHVFQFVITDVPRTHHWLIVASDRGRRKSLNLITLQEIVELFLVGGRDYPSSIHSVLEEGNDDYTVWLS